MSLSVGAPLGHYEVTAKLGEGGMGEVWEATDTTLNRQVALKILPEAFAADPDRLARFQREAQVLASLNHPNIAAIHGLEDSEGTKVGARLVRGTRGAPAGQLNITVLRAAAPRRRWPSPTPHVRGRAIDSSNWNTGGVGGGGRMRRVGVINDGGAGHGRTAQLAMGQRR